VTIRQRLAGSLLLLAVFLMGWQWGPGLVGLPVYFVPPLSAVVAEFGRMVTQEQLLHHTLVTAGSVVVGFVGGSAIGMIAGYLLGLSATAEIMLSPYILGLQIAPKVAFAPLFILWFGYTAFPRILVAILITFFPVLVNVLSAVRAVDPDLINLARSLSASRAQVFWKVEFPSSLPSLFAGLRIAATLAVIGVVVGEMSGGNSGLGYLLTYGEGQADTPMVFVSIIMLTLIGIVVYLAVAGAERGLLGWRPTAAGV
jgi:NitT/TauT family transport system permease protein